MNLQEPPRFVEKVIIRKHSAYPALTVSICLRLVCPTRRFAALKVDRAAKDARMKKCCKSVFHIWTSFICRRAAGALK